MNIGASFFGWIVAIGIAVLLTSIVGAVGAAVGFSGNLSQSEAERQAGTIGIAAAIVLLLVLMIGYYAGGYVAGRMSRFDGGRQGFMVWLIGLLVTIVAIVLGAVFGSQYNILDRVSLPRVPVSRSARLGRLDHGCRGPARRARRGHGREGGAGTTTASTGPPGDEVRLWLSTPPG